MNHKIVIEASVSHQSHSRCPFAEQEQNERTY